VLKSTWTDPKLDEHFARGMLISAAAMASCMMMVAMVPVSSSTLAEGVVWVPEEMWVRAGSDGFVDRIVARENSQVKAGDILVVCKAPELNARRAVVLARLAELRVRYTIAIKDDRMQAQLLQDEMRQAQAQYTYLTERIDALTIRSSRDGMFMIREPENLPGRFVRRGEMLAYVVQQGHLHVRAVVMQESIQQVRADTQYVEMRLSENFLEVFEASLLHEVPAAIHALPSMALAIEGGGTIALDPESKDEAKSFKSMFQFDIGLPGQLNAKAMGSRVYVRFVHADESLAWQWYRQLRQTFLSVLHV